MTRYEFCKDKYSIKEACKACVVSTSIYNNYNIYERYKAYLMLNSDNYNAVANTAIDANISIQYVYRIINFFESEI